VLRVSWLRGRLSRFCTPDRSPNSMEDISKSYMVGSCHRHANGYGYGTRVPTERNNPGLASVPKYKMHPDHDRMVTGSRSRDLGYMGHKADMRQAQSLTLQTSGDYGKFLFPVETKVSARNNRTLPDSMTRLNTRPLTTNGAFNNSLSFTSSNQSEFSRPQTQSRTSNSSTDPSRPAPATAVDRNQNTLSSTLRDYRTLDTTLPGHCKFDLRASTVQPNKKVSEVGWSINSNILAHNQSMDWRLGLRHPKKPSTAGTGGVRTPSPAVLL
jgi:hypothetical protein